ncbi:hypothetical protein J2Z66_008602 [Paenibacillus eucommiae]|uniref:Uncharacterized protein n=1 Tax=Paenibacillus eucommiae TaxID=1355755 RepID=A0ABS4JAP1_9BACL|nr:hypothetical protein [Paenibacillus eucommiae]
MRSLGLLPRKLRRIIRRMPVGQEDSSSSFLVGGIRKAGCCRRARSRPELQQPSSGPMRAFRSFFFTRAGCCSKELKRTIRWGADWLGRQQLAALSWS